MSLPRLGAVQAEQAIRRKLGEGLRGTYGSTLSEPLPSDWLKLIDNLEAGRAADQWNSTHPMVLRGITIPAKNGRS